MEVEGKHEVGADDAAARERFVAMLHRLQDEICAAVAGLDGTAFREDAWEKEDKTLGGGRSRVLQDGNVFEKAGVSVAVVRGELQAAAAKAMREQGRLEGPLGEARFYAAGLSLVIHPKNPMAPTAHLNYRFFAVTDAAGHETWWFGGGADLTPAYLFEEDAAEFHAVLKAACDAHDPDFYGRFKRGCDEYFFLPHRGEARGVGGIFFDDLRERPALAPDSMSTRDALAAFCEDCLSTFASTYTGIVARRKDMPFTPKQKEWQQLRRGRYVEFNLIHDRGTKFGLSTPQNARIESVLMSMPLTARWEYMHEVPPDSEEAKLIEVLQRPREWA